MPLFERNQNKFYIFSINMCIKTHLCNRRTLKGAALVNWPILNPQKIYLNWQIIHFHHNRCTLKNGQETIKWHSDGYDRHTRWVLGPLRNIWILTFLNFVLTVSILYVVQFFVTARKHIEFRKPVGDYVAKTPQAGQKFKGILTHGLSNCIPMEQF